MNPEQSNAKQRNTTANGRFSHGTNPVATRNTAAPTFAGMNKNSKCSVGSKVIDLQ